jgi:TolB-like protein
VPDRPSIAVLPFDHLSNDSEQDNFSVGISEEIITTGHVFHVPLIDADLFLKDANH